MEELEKYAILIHEALFSEDDIVQLEGQELEIRRFLSSGVRYVDFKGYRFVEQNPQKKSQWAEKARQGHQITWVFKGRSYYAQVFDGEFKKLGQN